MLLTKLLSYGSCKLYKLAEDKNEYKRLKRTLSKENKLGHLDETLVNDVLMGEALKQLSSQQEIYLLHDPSDIRKPHSKQTAFSLLLTCMKLMSKKFMMIMSFYSPN